jgi:hypothetical protein
VHTTQIALSGSQTERGSSADSVCSPQGTGMAGFIGYKRATAPSPRTNYTFAGASVDVSSWQVVDAPHDFVISLNNSFQQSADQRHGFLPRTVSWYRKAFVLPSE